jgi:hypothetical protein
MSHSAHPAAWDVERLLEQCEIQRTRRSGPGGQHRNKVETAVVITHLPSGIRAEAGERRSQEENRRRAVTRLRLRLAVTWREPLVPGRRPSSCWERHREGRRIRTSARHDDFPALLAEALDWVHGREGDVAAAADDLGITSSQLARLLRRHPPAWQLVQELRLKSGWRRLK